MIGHRPAHHAATEGIHYDRQVQQPRPGRDVRDVGNPQAIGCTDHEVTLHQIGHRLRVKASTSRTNPPPSANALKPRLAHQASYSLAAYPNTVGCQLGMHSRHAIGGTAGPVDRLDTSL